MGIVNYGVDASATVARNAVAAAYAVAMDERVTGGDRPAVMRDKGVETVRVGQALMGAAGMTWAADVAKLSAAQALIEVCTQPPSRCLPYLAVTDMQAAYAAIIAAIAAA